MNEVPEYQQEFLEYHDITCEPTQPHRCTRCGDEDLDQVYCSSTGFKQEVRCLAASHTNNSDQESYMTFQSCAERASTFSGLVKFELLMVLLFAISFSFATKRKKKLLAIQHHRIASYLSH
ncbi:hypothetical protein AB1Y20_013355 [Prymnesium parvum]|uniref:Uncharacterized protein n=1 Tax=Prymnesium parvum TaxID=97485 RepID=A0AB34ILH7_PRYPA|mmetsp:Transcript_30088/g.75175  ORF Transcript_30088/g.75175 Transcript_30088/m.75175 type:complete len:121 (-) Transcript_30088:237-599(-)